MGHTRYSITLRVSQLHGRVYGGRHSLCFPQVTGVPGGGKCVAIDPCPHHTCSSCACFSSTRMRLGLFTARELNRRLSVTRYMILISRACSRQHHVVQEQYFIASEERMTEYLHCGNEEGVDSMNISGISRRRSFPSK